LCITDRARDDDLEVGEGLLGEAFEAEVEQVWTIARGNDDSVTWHLLG
jgi:hypothetical protein